MMNEFGRWWLEQLMSLVPLRWGDGQLRERDHILLRVEGDGFAAIAQRRGSAHPLGRFGAEARGQAALAAAARQAGVDRLPVVLSTPPYHLLRKELSLPLVARSDLSQALSFELERLTPFRAAEIVWRHRIVRLDRSRDRLDVELLLLPRFAFEAAASLVKGAGLQAAAVVVEDRGTTAEFDLGEAGVKPVTGPRPLRRALAAMAALLLIVAVGLPYVRLNAALNGAREASLPARAAATEAASIRAEIERLTRAERFIREVRARAPDPLQVLAAATETLPDNTYLTEFSLRGEQATLTGQSPAAADLIAALTRNAAFRNPTFGAPVVKSEGSKLELFTIRVQLQPGAD